MEKIRICFTSPSQWAYSETFIQNLKGILEGDVYYCFNGDFPIMSEDGELRNLYFAPLLFKGVSRLGWLKKAINEIFFESYLKRKKIHVIVANYGPSGAALTDISKRLGIPLIVHFHGYDASVQSVISKYRQSYHKMFKVAKAIIVVSEEMKQDLINIGAPKTKIKKIVYAPSSEFLKIQPNYHSNQVLAIGRFVEKKAPNLTLMVFKSVKEKCPDLKLKFIGDGNLMSVCTDLTKKLNIRDVEFAGVLTPKQIQNEMKNSFCFIQHSKRACNGDKEGTPVAIMEALGAGLPVVSTNHAGIPEVVIDKENGFIVEEGNVEGMAEKLIQLYLNRELAENLGQNGKNSIRRNYSKSEYSKKINDLITESVFG